MKTKVAINGFGRIGRLSFRLLFDDPDVEIVAINSTMTNENNAYLLEYDTAHGRYKHGKITAKENSIIVDNKEINVYAERDPKKPTLE